MSHDSEWWKRVEEVYHAVHDLRGEERSRYLDTACASDAAMRRQIEVLLQQDENPDSLLNTRSGPGPMFPPSGIELGSYRIETPIGEGGMGVVYRARYQAQPAGRD